MNNKAFTVELKCLFCNFPLEEDSDKEYSSGDLLKCQKCGESNDYDSLISVATEEGKEKVSEYVEEEIEKMLKDIFK